MEKQLTTPPEDALQDDSPLDRLRRWQRGETPGPWYSIAILGNGGVGPCCPAWHDDAPNTADTPLREI